tara:strand:- start:5757 stop:6248 length:492 start_codon:yes stop_codon:yes gene_type:complete
MHWRNLMKDNKYLGSWDLEVNGKYEPKLVTIKKIYQDVFVGEMGKEDKVFLMMNEFDKPMVCNRSNFKRLEKFFGTFDYNEYIGKQIVLNTEKVKSPQGMVDALRFSTRPLPKKTKKVLTDDQMEKATESVSNGRSTLAKISAVYELSDSQIKTLKDAENKSK